MYFCEPHNVPLVPMSGDAISCVLTFGEKGGLLFGAAVCP